MGSITPILTENHWACCLAMITRYIKIVVEDEVNITNTSVITCDCIGSVMGPKREHSTFYKNPEIRNSSLSLNRSKYCWIPAYRNPNYAESIEMDLLSPHRVFGTIVYVSVSWFYNSSFTAWKSYSVEYSRDKKKWTHVGKFDAPPRGNISTGYFPFPVIARCGHIFFSRLQV